MASSEKNKTVMIILAIIIAIVIFIGIGMIGYGTWRNRMVFNINTWPKVDATVISVNSASGKPSIEYKYKINGVIFHSNNIVYSNYIIYRPVDVKRELRHLHPGSIIKVFYNPNKHSQAYIFSGMPNCLEIGLGFSLLIIATLIGCTGFLKMNKSSSTDLMEY